MSGKLVPCFVKRLRLRWGEEGLSSMYPLLCDRLHGVCCPMEDAVMKSLQFLPFLYTARYLAPSVQVLLFGSNALLSPSTRGLSKWVVMASSLYRSEKARLDNVMVLSEDICNGTSDVCFARVLSLVRV